MVLFYFEAKENFKACSQGQNAESLPNGCLKICLELPRTEIYRSYYVWNFWFYVFLSKSFHYFLFFLSKNAIDLIFILKFFLKFDWLTNTDSFFILFSLNDLTQIGTGTQSDNIKVSTQEAVPKIYTPT